jgi:hypothetical protein
MTTNKQYQQEKYKLYIEKYVKINMMGQNGFFFIKQSTNQN